MLLLVGIAVLINLLVIGISYEGELPIIIWISFIPYTISVLLALITAQLFFQKCKRTPSPASKRPGFRPRVSSANFHDWL